MKLEQKKIVVDDLKNQISGTKGVWLTDFSGVNTITLTKLRKTLKGSKIGYRVVKNTLLERTLKGTEYENLTENIKGSLAMCFGEDVVLGSRILRDFQKEIDLSLQANKFTVKKAWLEGKIYEKEGVYEIANIPSSEILIGSVLTILTTPVANLVNVLKAVLARCVSVLDEIKKIPQEESVSESQTNS